MAYYNRDGEVLKDMRTEMKYLTSGTCASVWHNGEIIWKEYFASTNKKYRLSEQMFDILKDINDDHFIKLLDIYSDMELPVMMQQYKKGLREFIVDAYIAEYYSDDSVNVFHEPMSYILDNFRGLEALFDIFTDNALLQKM